LVQIKNSAGFVESLSWIAGDLEKNQSFSPAVSWIPSDSGTYTVTVFVWNSLTNPIALNPTVEFTVDVT
ncbi:MAG: hypothetical protein COW27_05780, partial [Nitrosopumilales archaeon CG15_BIG_FIL_POST_REV_8_21_14_020_37_12]